MKKKVFLIPLAMFMAAGTVSLAGCGEQKPDPTPVVQKLESISVSKLPTKLEYNAGDAFDPTGLEVTAKYSDGSTKVLAGTDYTLSPTQSLPAGTTKVTVSYEEGGVSKTAEIGVTVHAAPVAKVLSEIVVATQPTQTHYVAGDDFNPEGMSISAKYSDGSEATIAGTDYTISPLHELAADTDHVTITYEEGGVSKSVNVAITVDALPVQKVLKDIIVDIDPNKTDYLEHEDFDPEGMEVYAIYSDDSRKEIFGNEYTIDPLHDLAEGTDHVTVSYTEGDVTKTAAVAITVTKGEFVPVESIKYTLNPKVYTIEVGQEIGLLLEIEPSNATNKNVTYEFSSEGVVSIVDGKIKGLKAGETDIIIKTSNEEVSAKISGFKVKNPDVVLPDVTAAGFEKFTEGALKNGELINIVAVYGDDILGMGAYDTGTYISPTNLSVDGDRKLVVGEALNYTALLNNDGTYSLKDSNGKFLSLADSGNNVKFVDVVDENAKFVISHGEGGVTKIVGANTAKESRFLVYNAGSPRFSFYKESTAATYPQLIVYHNGEEAEHKDVTGVEFKAESYTVEVGYTVNVAAGVLPVDATDQEVTYSLEDVEPVGCATISGNVITGVAEGTAKVVATTHDGGFTANVHLTVIPEQVPEHEGTEADPFTAADAILIARNLEHKEVTEQSYYIKDTVTKTEKFDASFGNYSFWFGDFECYRMWKNSLNNKFTSADEIEVGDVVTVVAKITRYNQTLETAEKTGYTVNIQKPVIPATGVTLDKSELTMEVGSIPQQLVATVAPEKASQEVIWSSSDESKVTVDDGLVTALAATEEETPVIITAKVASNESLTATCEVTVTPKTRVMTGITATGLEKTEYTVGEKLDLTGLVVEAVYDDKSTEPIASGYTTNIALDHALELTDTSLVVSYEEFDADPITLTISEPQPIVAEGTYVIKHVVDETTYYLKENGTSSAPSAVTNVEDATIFRFALVDGTLDTYTIKTLEGKYLYSTKSNDGVRVGGTEFSWIIEEGVSTLGGAFNIKQTLALDSSKSETARYLTLYNNSDFRTYNSATASNRKQNSDLESVIVKEVDHIAVEQEPTKKSYYVGDTIDLTGLVVRAYYTDGTDEIISNDKLTVSPKTFQAAAEQRDITVTYQEKTAHFKVEVKEDDRTIESIKIDESSVLVKKVYEVGDSWDANGVKVIGVRNDSTEVELKEGIIFEFDSEKAAAGITSLGITAKYNNGVTDLTASKSFEVTVNTPEEGVTPITLSTEGGTSASACKVIYDSVEKAGIKCGTGSVVGGMKVTVPANAKTLILYAAAWKGETVALSVENGDTLVSTLTLTADDGVSSSSPFTIKAVDDSKFKFTIDFGEALTADTTLTLKATSGKRFVVWNAGYTKQAL